MKQIPIFRYVRPDGGITISTTKPAGEYDELVRLVADEKMMLTDGISQLCCVDTDTPSAWTEIKCDGSGLF